MALIRVDDEKFHLIEPDYFLLYLAPPHGDTAQHTKVKVIEIDMRHKMVTIELTQDYIVNGSVYHTAGTRIRTRVGLYATRKGE